MVVQQRPTAYKLGDEVEASIIDSAGDALVIYYYHGLSDGDVVYIKSEVESYNGYKFIDVIDPVSFKIRNTESGEDIGFKKEVTASYFPSVLEHGWVSVHQPIVYQISNDKYPVNETYVVATITTYSNNNGYLRIVCSGNITSGLQAFDYITIGNYGVARVKQVESDSICTLDVAYDSSLAINGQMVQFYYHNYHILVRVYGGLNNSHPYVSSKPYKLLATLRFVPDDNNLVTFDISEILRGDVNGENNLLLDQLPLNLNAFTQFYIEYAESYDESDGSEIETFTSSYTTDTFEGYAVDAVMPFKSRAINTLSEYVGSSNIQGKFLTLMDRPILIPGLYFDLSFIKSQDGDYVISVNGNLIYMPDKGIGIYRVELTPELLYSEDEICIYAYIPQQTIYMTVPELQDLDQFINYDLGSTDWTPGAAPSITVSSPVFTNRLMGQLSNVSIGVTYTFNYNYDITVNSGTGSGDVFFRLWPDPVTEISVNQAVPIQAGTQNYSGSVSLNSPSVQPVYFGIIVLGSTGGAGNITIVINSLSIVAGDSETVIPLVQMTQELCIDVVDLCATDPTTGSSEDCNCDDFILNEGEGYILLE